MSMILKAGLPGVGFPLYEEMNQPTMPRKRRRCEVGPIARELEQLADLNSPAMCGEVSRLLRDMARRMEGGK
jgi:hypothetical protein